MLGAGLAEPALDDVDRDAAHQHVGGRAVPKVVQPDAGQPESLTAEPELGTDVFRGECSAVVVAEHQPLIVVAGAVQQALPACSVRSERRTEIVLLSSAIVRRLAVVLGCDIEATNAADGRPRHHPTDHGDSVTKGCP